MSEHITNASQLTMSPVTLARFQDRSEWLPVREVIREAASFAIGRQGNDNAVEALLSGLAGLGIVIPESVTASIKLTGAVRITDRIMLAQSAENDETIAAFQSAAQQLRNVAGYGYADGYNPASNGLLANAVRLAGPGFPDWTVESAQSSIGRCERDYYTPTVLGFGHSITINVERMIPASEAERGALDEWQYGQALKHRIAYFLPAMNRMMRRALVELSNGVLTRDMLLCSEDGNNYSASVRIPWTDEDTTRIAAAGQDADTLAGRHDYLRTNSFLAMMRDQAVENSWCGEHHRIIDTLTEGTRQPYGKVITVTRVVEQEFTFTADTFYGVDMDDIEDYVNNMLDGNDSIRYAIRDRFGVYPDVTMDERNTEVVMRNTED